MLEFDEKAQTAFIEWVTYQHSIYQGSTKNNIFTQNKYTERQYEISEDIHKVLVHSKPQELITFLHGKKYVYQLLYRTGHLFQAIFYYTAFFIFSTILNLLYSLIFKYHCFEHLILGFLAAFDV